MGMHYFAFIVGEDVFTLSSFDDSFPGNAPIIAGMNSDPIVIPTNNSDIHLGWKYINGEFVPPQHHHIVAPDYEVDDE
jgi:hypothetical protein